MLPDADAERRVHEYLRITEVFLLTRVCTTWRSTVLAYLRSMPWDAIHIDQVDPHALLWLANLAKARVKLRSVCMVRQTCALVQLVMARGLRCSC